MTEPLSPKALRNLRGLASEVVKGASENPVRRRSLTVGLLVTTSLLLLGTFLLLHSTRPPADRTTAYALFEDALALCYTSEPSWDEFAKRLELAREAVQKDETDQGETSQGQLTLGRIEAERGENAAAIIHYQRAIELDPRTPEAHLRLAMLLLTRERRTAPELSMTLNPQAEDHLKLALSDRGALPSPLLVDLAESWLAFCTCDYESARRKAQEGVNRYAPRPGSEEFIRVLILLPSAADDRVLINDALRIRPLFPDPLFDRTSHPRSTR